MSTVSKKKAIEQLVDASVKNFAEGISERHIREVTDPNGVINGKRNNEYFMLKNQFPDANIKLRFATAYNRFGEGNAWKQSSVRRCFAEEELMIETIGIIFVKINMVLILYSSSIKKVLYIYKRP